MRYALLQGIRADGVSGALDVIEHPRGVLANLSFAPRPAMFRGLGEIWLTDTLAYKRRFLADAVSGEFLVLFEHDPVVTAAYLRERAGKVVVEPA